MAITQTLGRVTFTRACAVSSNEIYISCSPDDHDVGYPFSRVSRYLDGNWEHKDYDFWISAIASYQENKTDEPEIFVIAETGQASIFRDPSVREIVDKLNPDRSNKGYLFSAIQVGTHLYACGMNGLNYKRYQNGVWRILDNTILEDEGNSADKLFEIFANNLSLANNKEFVGSFVEHLTADTSASFQYIAGLSEDSIYICGGKGNLASELMQWRGDKFETLLAPPDERDDQYTPSLNHILFEDGEDKIRVCGQQGAMLIGNAVKGFEQDPAAIEDDDIVYYKMALFNDQIYLATSLGLHVHDGSQIKRVRTGLEPDAIDTHTVEAIDDVLWVVGTKDILRFDGNQWERIPYPGNQPL